METGIWLYIHILLLVFWLGTDLGVFILALAARRPDLSFEQRAVLLKYGLVIDVLPRICLTMSLPVALHLAARLGLVTLPTWVFASAWVVGIAWLGLLYAMYRAEGSSLQARLSTANLWLQGGLGVLLIGAGVTSLSGGGLPVPPWLAWKVLLFGAIFPCAIMIDVQFRPMTPAFERLAKEGSTPELEVLISRTVSRAIVWVLAIYALILAIAFLGAVKP